MSGVKVAGAGLAGCECAYQLALRGISVTLYEMKPEKRTPAHRDDTYGELVCSNSLRGDRLENAPGLLKAEMRKLGSLILRAADSSKVPSGGALAVDRTLFSSLITKTIEEHPLIEVEHRELTSVPDGDMVVIATGPLTSGPLATDVSRVLGSKLLSFYDAAAPIVSAESIDMNNAYCGDRYGNGEGSYINCPLEKDEYAAFRRALAEAEQAPVHGFEDAKVFEGCIPAEVLARRGEDTLRFGPMRPVGLRDPRTGKGAYAVMQLRRENLHGTMYNLVGFQTHLTFPEQRRVFSMIPALRNAEFLRYGVMHRNTFIDAPRLLDANYCLRDKPGLYFAGQISGVEGYVESAASGLTAGLAIASRLAGQSPPELPPDTAIGALARYTSSAQTSNFQPMNVNFGLFPPLEKPPKAKKERYRLISERALSALDNWICGHPCY